MKNNADYNKTRSEPRFAVCLFWSFCNFFDSLTGTVRRHDWCADYKLYCQHHLLYTFVRVIHCSFRQPKQSKRSLTCKQTTQKHLCCGDIVLNVEEQKRSCFPFSTREPQLKHSVYYKTMANLHLLHTNSLHWRTFCSLRNIITTATNKRRKA